MAPEHRVIEESPRLGDPGRIRMLQERGSSVLFESFDIMWLP
jgi:hypothetical protein